MTNPYGYQAQQPGPGFAAYPQQFQQQPPRSPHRATAVIAALLGLILGGIVAYLPVYVLLDISAGASIGDLPGEALTVLGLYLGAAIVLLLGAVVTLFRAVFGAVLLIIGALLTLASALLEPALLYEAAYGLFFQLMFQFEADAAFVRVCAIVLAPIVLLFAALRPTFRYLSHKPVPHNPYARQPGYSAPQQGYPPHHGGQPPAR